MLIRINLVLFFTQSEPWTQVRLLSGVGLGVFQMSELVAPESARWTAGHWPLDLGMEVAGGDQGRSAHDELLEVQEVKGLRDRIVQEGSDWRQAINMPRRAAGS